MSDFNATVRRIALVNAQIKSMEEERKELIKSLGKLKIDNYPAGDYILQVQPNRRFDPSLAEALLSESEWDAIQETKPSAAKAKALLAPTEYEMLMKDYPDPKIVIKEVTDA